jgi:hypothetical protein
MVNFIENLVKKTDQGWQVQWEDDIVKGTLVTHAGSIVHPQVKQWLNIGGPAS